MSKAEFERGMKLMRLKYSDTLEINIDKLTSRLMFEDEKTTCGSAACLFFMFTILYIVVLTMQVRLWARWFKPVGALTLVFLCSSTRRIRTKSPRCASRRTFPRYFDCQSQCEWVCRA